MTTVSHISATLGSKLLRNSDRYFTNDDAAILDEMIQNARRAGAGTVTFTAEGADLIIADDGKGLPADKAGVLLALGDSNNDDVVETAENAAGLGFFSLANFDVEVVSQNWSMTVPKAAFTGGATATLQTTQGYRAGLTIRIREFLSKKNLHTIGELILKSTRYSTMTADLVGFPVSCNRQEPKEFVSEHVGSYPHASITSNGVTVTVVRTPRSNDAPAHINFFGKVISSDLVRSKAIPKSEEIASLDKRGNVEEHKIYNVVLVDVHDTSSLRLQLPQRQALIENEGLSLVRELTRRAYISLLQREGVANGLPMNDRLRTQVKNIPAPRVAVSAIDGERYVAVGNELRGRSGIVPANMAFAMVEFPITNTDGSLLKSLLSSVEHAPFASDRLFDASDLAEAFAPGHFGIVSAIDLVITNDEDETIVRLNSAFEGDRGTTYAELTMDELDTAMRDADEAAQYFDKVVDALALKFVCTTGDGHEMTLAHQIAGIFFAECGDEWNPTIIVSKGWDGSLPTMMVNGIDWYNDDAGANSYDDQQSEHDRQYTRLVSAITGNEAGNFLDEVRDRVREILYSFEMDAIAKAGALNLKISIDPEKRGWDAVSIEKLAA